MSDAALSGIVIGAVLSIPATILILVSLKIKSWWDDRYERRFQRFFDKRAAESKRETE